ncbi:MAG: succinate dehydrogenase, hydrophobic membrane anchor protein [Gammaproteobacteria bacterium]|nr:succinate dehydrogenase, hydrophobic membrane anchor protein [Gammaproteobacteria bacterium]
MNTRRVGKSEGPVEFRTPLKKARNLGSAKSGTSHFWWQRATAVLLVPLVAWFVGTLVSLVGADLATVQETIARPWNAILFAAFILATFWHAKMGLQVVVEDYIHTGWLHLLLQLVVIFVCALAALASLYAIARIALLA